MHRRVLRTEKWLWYSQDIMIPLAVAIVAALTCRWLIPNDLGRLGELGALLICSACVMTAVAAAVPLVREQLVQHLMIGNQD
jgi:hypothetical protein